MKGRPIRPEEVDSFSEIPAEVFDAFNELISKNMDQGRATVKQREVADLAAEKIGCKVGDLFVNHWLNIETAYETAGWKVTYDKPGYNETYEAFFVFEKR